MIGILTHHVR